MPAHNPLERLRRTIIRLLGGNIGRPTIVIGAGQIRNGLPLRHAFTQAGGDPMAWEALKHRKKHISAAVMQIEVYACLEDDRWLSVYMVADKLNCTHSTCGSTLTRLFKDGWLERQKIKATTDTRTLYFYRRKVPNRSAVA